jgi:hypothetical protein
MSNNTSLYGTGSLIPAGDNVIITGTLTVNGCAILTDCSTFNLLPFNATTVNVGGSATTLALGATTGVTTIRNQLATANYDFPVADGTVFFATANLGSEYSGTQAIDRALLDRFFPIELDYPKVEDEIKVLMLRTGVDEKVATAIVKVSNEIRKQYKEQELSSAISVRHTLQAASLVSDGFEVDKALLSTIMPLFEDGIGVSERSKVLSIVSAF